MAYSKLNTAKTRLSLDDFKALKLCITQTIHPLINQTKATPMAVAMSPEFLNDLSGTSTILTISCRIFVGNNAYKTPSITKTRANAVNKSSKK
jgi:hypothetical protein